LNVSNVSVYAMTVLHRLLTVASALR